MLGLARFAMKSPLHIGILAALFALVPMLYVVSAALVALTTLRFGVTSGTRTLIMALGGGVVSWLMTGIPLSLLVLVWVTPLAIVLRETQSWNRVLLVGSVSGLIIALVVQVLFQEQFNSMVDVFQGVFSDGDTATAEFQLIESVRPLMGYLIISSQMMETLLALLLARYWQSGLFNPGGLKAEMHVLRFNWHEILILLAALTLSLIVVPGAVMLFGIPFVFAGMAFMHGVVAKLKLGGQWLVALYIALIMFNQIIVPLLIIVVVADSFLDLKARIPQRDKSDDE